MPQRVYGIFPAGSNVWSDGGPGFKLLDINGVDTTFSNGDSVEFGSSTLDATLDSSVVVSPVTGFSEPLKVSTLTNNRTITGTGSIVATNAPINFANSGSSFFLDVLLSGSTAINVTAGNNAGEPNNLGKTNTATGAVTFSGTFPSLFIRNNNGYGTGNLVVSSGVSARIGLSSATWSAGTSPTSVSIPNAVILQSSTNLFVFTPTSKQLTMSGNMSGGGIFKHMGAGTLSLAGQSTLPSYQASTSSGGTLVFEDLTKFGAIINLYYDNTLTNTVQGGHEIKSDYSGNVGFSINSASGGTLNGGNTHSFRLYRKTLGAAPSLTVTNAVLTGSTFKFYGAPASGDSLNQGTPKLTITNVQLATSSPTYTTTTISPETLDVELTNVTIATNAGAKTIILSGSSNNSTVGAITNGIGSLSTVLDGTGTWTLTGSVSSTNAQLLMRRGTLLFSNSQQIPTSGITVDVAGTGGGSPTLGIASGNISLTRPIAINPGTTLQLSGGTGVLTLSSSVVNNGTLIIASGSVKRLATAGSITGFGTFTIASGASFVTDSASALPSAITITSANTGFIENSSSSGSAFIYSGTINATGANLRLKSSVSSNVATISNTITANSSSKVYADSGTWILGSTTLAGELYAENATLVVKASTLSKLFPVTGGAIGVMSVGSYGQINNLGGKISIRNNTTNSFYAASFSSFKATGSNIDGTINVALDVTGTTAGMTSFSNDDTRAAFPTAGHSFTTNAVGQALNGNTVNIAINNTDTAKLVFSSPISGYGTINAVGVNKDISFVDYSTLQYLNGFSSNMSPLVSKLNLTNVTTRMNQGFLVTERSITPVLSLSNSKLIMVGEAQINARLELGVGVSEISTDGPLLLPMDRYLDTSGNGDRELVLSGGSYQSPYSQPNQLASLGWKLKDPTVGKTALRITPYTNSVNVGSAYNSGSQVNSVFIISRKSTHTGGTTIVDSFVKITDPEALKQGDIKFESTQSAVLALRHTTVYMTKIESVGKVTFKNVRLYCKTPDIY